MANKREECENKHKDKSHIERLRDEIERYSKYIVSPKKRRADWFKIDWNKLKFSDVIRTQKTDCLSILLDLKGTKAKLKTLGDEYINMMNYFYYMVESWFDYRGGNFGEFMGVSFSDSFYLEIYDPEKPKHKNWSSEPYPCAGCEIEDILSEILNLTGNIIAIGYDVRLYCSRGFTHRRVFQNYAVLFPGANKNMRPSILHPFGYGDSMMKVFDAEASHFEGLVFLEEPLCKTLKYFNKNKGEYVAKSTQAKFIRTV